MRRGAARLPTRRAVAFHDERLGTAVCSAPKLRQTGNKRGNKGSTLARAKPDPGPQLTPIVTISATNHPDVYFQFNHPPSSSFFDDPYGREKPQELASHQRARRVCNHPRNKSPHGHTHLHRAANTQSASDQIRTAGASRHDTRIKPLQPFPYAADTG